MKKGLLLLFALLSILFIFLTCSTPTPGGGDGGNNDDGTTGSPTAQTDITGMPAVELPLNYNSALLNISLSTVTVPSSFTGGFKPIGKAYEIKYNNEANTVFSSGFAKLKYSYKNTDLNTYSLLNEFVVFYYDAVNLNWKRVDITYKNLESDQVIAETSHFTTFVLTSMPVSSGTTVAAGPQNIITECPITGSCGAVFTVIDENFKYYMDRDYYVVPTASSSNNNTTFNALGFFGALGIATANGYNGSGINLGPQSAHKLYTGTDYITFTAHKAIDVYLMYDTRGGADAMDISEDADWLAAQGFTALITTTANPVPTRYFVETTDAVGLYTVYRKSYDAGEPVTLHGNRNGVTDPGIQTNYWLIIKSRGVYTNEPASTIATIPDTTPPANVTNLQATINPGSITLSWTNPADADFGGVVIRRSVIEPPTTTTEGTALTGTVLSPQSFRDESITIGETYYYTVFALDVNNNYQINGTYILVTVPSAAPSLSGHVRDTFGSSIAGAYIRLYNGVFSEYTASDVNGYYEFVSVPAGTYNLVIKRDGYTISTQIVTITL